MYGRSSTNKATNEFIRPVRETDWVIELQRKV